MAKKLSARDMLAKRVVELMSHPTRRLNRSELARRLDLSQPQVSQFLNGKRELSLGVLDRLSAVFETSVPELFMSPAQMYAGHDLTDEQRELLAAYEMADERVRRAISMLLDMSDSDVRTSRASGLSGDPSDIIADALVKAAGRLGGGSPGNPERVSSTRGDRRTQPGPRHRGTATRGA